MNIIAVIVTNNRLGLLKEAIGAVKGQSLKVSQLIVVDNDSTDGTREWLDEQTDLLVVHQANLGGSGGFSTGIRLAAELNADWIWVMDDDTICGMDTLSTLCEKLGTTDKEIGFIGSKCVWTDGSPHFMNIPNIKPSFNKRTPFNTYDQQRLLLIETCSFVSLLINARAVKAVGLPYKEFFIWGDDQEYTRRITKKGFLGLYSSESIALHKTAVNYFPDFYYENVNSIWKHRYGFRNEFFMVKKNKGMIYFMVWLMAKVSYTSFRIFSIRKDNRLKFIGVIVNSAWKSIFFNPKIDYLS